MNIAPQYRNNPDYVILENLLLKRFEDKLAVVSDESDPAKQRGETFRNKEKLKKAGFTWNSYINSWVLHQSKLQQAQQTLAQINKSPVERFIEKVEELPEFVLGAENVSKKDELMQKIEGFVEELAGAVDEAAASAAIKKFLEFNAKFRGYSWHNTLLIYIQRPNATKVAGFKQWEEKFHRRVKKGAKGISILAPIRSKRPEDRFSKPTQTPTGSPVTPAPGDEGGDEDEDRTKDRSFMRFMAVSVFDVSDTEPIDARGEVPEEPEWHGSNEPNQKAEEIFQTAVEVAKDMGVKIDVAAAKGGEQGWSSGEHINITSTVGGVNKAATVIHEIAHSLLHFKKSSPFYVGDFENEQPSTEPVDPTKPKEKPVLTREVAELQAESVSFVVIKYFGLPAEHQASYLALWRANKDSIKQNLTTIKRCSDFIITELEKTQDAKMKQQPQQPEQPTTEALFECVGGNRFKIKGA